MAVIRLTYICVCESDRIINKNEPHTVATLWCLQVRNTTAFSQLQYFVVNENEVANSPKSLPPESSCDQQNDIVIYYLLIL
jgi:hypothetical protein